MLLSFHQSGKKGLVTTGRLRESEKPSDQWGTEQQPLGRQGGKWVEAMPDTARVKGCKTPLGTDLAGASPEL